MKPYPIILAFGLFAPPIARAQQWYNAPPNGEPYYRLEGAAFTLNGKAYFGFGEDAFGVLSPAWQKYDPTTNTVSWLNGIGDRSHVVSFAVGGYGFIGLGNLSFLGDPPYVTGVIHKFDPSTEQWVGPIADFPPGPRIDATAFTIGNKAYVGGGVDVDTLGTNMVTNDLWEYDPAANTWTTRANMPALLASNARTFTLNGKGYVMPDGTNDLWEYDPVANTWAVRASYPSTPASGRVAFVLNGLGYVGCGNYGVDVQTFQAYDPIANTWTPAPALWYWTGRHSSWAFAIGSNAYVVGGQRTSYNDLLVDMWRFGAATTPAQATWTQRPFLPAAARIRPIAFSINDKAYVGGGTGGFGNLTDFWMYDAVSMIWTARAALPANAEVGFSINGIGYVVTSSATANFFAFDPVANAWSPRADMPGGARTSGVGFAMEGKGYVGGGSIGGVRTASFYGYDPLGNTWTQRLDIPGSARHSSCGFAIGNKGYIVCGNFSGSSTTSGAMFRYDPVLNTWTSAASFPYNTNGTQNSMAFVVGNKAYLGGGLIGGPTLSRRFYVYEPTTNVWTQLSNTGGGYRYNGIGFSIGTKGYMCGGYLEPDTISPFLNNADRSNDLWEYNPATITVAAKVFLEGPFNQVTGKMNDALRSAGLLNTIDPYGANGYPYPGGDYSDRPIQVPSTSGNDAVVDRVVVELREPAAPYAVKASRSLWLQRDGDVVDMDGISVPKFTAPPGTYQIAIRHRSHLGAMTTAGFALSSLPTAVDLTLGGTATYGTNARDTMGAYMVLWAGDVTFNGQLKYAGQANDRDPILVRIGGLDPLNTVTGYYPEDVNMNGVVKYTGANNDRDPILVNLGGMVLGTRNAQLP
ncbi:MAG: kelch repeat-containing protein [Flavobacteriales bacterium]